MKRPSLRTHFSYTLATTWCLLLVASCRSFWVQPYPTHSLDMAFFVTNYIGYYFFIAALSSTLCISLLSIPGLKRFRTTVTASSIILTVCLSMAASLVYSVWRMGINNNLLQFAFAPNAGQIIEVSGAFVVDLCLALTIMLSVCILAAMLIKKLSDKKHTRSLYILLSLGLSFFIGSQTWTLISLRSNQANLLVLTQKLPQFQHLAMTRWIDALLPEQKQLDNTVRKLLAQNKPITMPRIHGKTPKDSPNILLIVVDTLRADMLAPNTMPNTFDFSLKADRFFDHLSGGNCTQPGIFSLFYSIPSTYWDSAINHPKAPPLIERLQQLHYHIDLLSSAPLTVPNFDRALFPTVTAAGITQGENAMARDMAVTQKAIRILKRDNKAQKHFTFVFLDSVHSYNSLSQLNHPWTPQAALNYLSLTRETDRTPIFNRYKNAVYFDDGLIGKLINTLKETHQLDNTLVIITADHGQSFNDLKQNYWEHASNFARFEMQVPLLIHWPHQHIKQNIHYRTTHFDIAPTIWRRALGVDANPYPWSVGHDIYSHHPVPWLIAQSYTDTALINPKRIVMFYPSGNHSITDQNLKRLNKKTPASAIHTLMNDASRFFAKKEKVVDN